MQSFQLRSPLYQAFICAWLVALGISFVVNVTNPSSPGESPVCGR